MPSKHFSPKIRLLSQIRRVRGCWVWTGHTFGRDKRAYLPALGEIYGHRVSYRIFRGPIPTNKQVLHTCDNPTCVNPNHLFLGNHSVNMRDAYSKKRKSNKGSKNPRAKITPTIVREIRRRYLKEGGAKLAKEFGLDRTQPFRIYNRITWKSVC